MIDFLSILNEEYFNNYFTFFVSGYDLAYMMMPPPARPGFNCKPFSSNHGVKVGRFPCPNPNCKSVFKEKRHLGTHINYHCGKPPRFQCPYCDYRSHLKTNVKIHEQKRHPGQEVWVAERYR